jgi:hypothetical protein
MVIGKKRALPETSFKSINQVTRGGEKLPVDQAWKWIPKHRRVEKACREDSNERRRLDIRSCYSHGHGAIVGANTSSVLEER